MLSGIPKTTSATQEKGHSLSQGPLLCPTRPEDGLGVMWPGTALASNSGAQIPSLPHLQSPRLPAAEQKTETGTGRRRGKALLSPWGCLDKHEAALQHPSPSQPPGEWPGDLPCSSHHPTPVPLSGQAGMELMGLVATWTSAMIPGQGHPKRRAGELGHQHRLVMGPQKQPLGTTKTAPWVPRSLEDKQGAASVGLSSILFLLLLFLCHPGSMWEGDGTRAWLARL